MDYFLKDIFLGIDEDLHRAIFSGNEDELNNILDSFKPTNLIQRAESQILIKAAIERKRLGIAKILVKKMCIIDDTMTLYPQALLCGDVELVSLLLDKDPQSVHKRLEGDTLLHMAVRNEIISMVKLLIDRGANVNLADQYGFFPLNYAAKVGNYDILKCLLDSGADIESKSLHERQTSLVFAIEFWVIAFEHKETYNLVAMELLNAGANVNIRNNFGRTPLHLACSSEYNNIIPHLLNAGADVNNIDVEGRVPSDQFMANKLSCQCIYRSLPYPLVKHLILLKEAGLYLHKRNQQIINVIIGTCCQDITVHYNVVSPSSSKIKRVIEMCQKEIDVMKVVKTVNGTVLCDILKKLDNFSLYSATQSEIQLLNTVISQNKFPLYTVILKTHLKYAKLRRSLLAQAQSCLASLIPLSDSKLPFLPEEIRVHIVSYLETSELDSFINTLTAKGKQRNLFQKLNIFYRIKF